VELDLALGKPLEFVPSCVISEVLPHHRMKDGWLTKRYEELLEWVEQQEYVMHALCLEEGATGLVGEECAMAVLTDTANALWCLLPWIDAWD
jgi:hypothetical protein